MWSRVLAPSGLGSDFKPPSLHLLAEYCMYRYIFPIRCILGLRDTYLLTDIFSDLNCTFFLFTWGWELVTKLLFLHHDAWTRLLARDVADRQRKIYFQLHLPPSPNPQCLLISHFLCVLHLEDAKPATIISFPPHHSRSVETLGRRLNGFWGLS